MNFSLKGITKGSSVSSLKNLALESFAIDLRPTSLNFTSFKNIAHICELQADVSYKFIFSVEPVNIILESIKRVEESCRKADLEFSGVVDFKELDTLNRSYSWRYNEESSFKEIVKAKNLNRIIFSHSFLEVLAQKDELFGFLCLFRDGDLSELSYELLLDWDSSLLESMFSYFSFDCISFEVNSRVELSYQNLDYDHILKQFEHLKFYILQKEQGNAKNINIK